MIHEHDDLVLASAAIDFSLTPDEADRLRRAIADCPVCAERAVAYRRQVQLLAELPALEPSEAVRRRVAMMAMTGGRSRPSTPLLLLAAAFLIGALLAVAAAAGGAFQDRTFGELPPVDGSTQPGPSTIAIAPSRPAPDASQPVGPGGPGAPPTLAIDSIAEVVSNNLRVRSLPRVVAESIKFEPLLSIGDRLFVIAGPVNADDYDWYQVAVWRPSNADATWPIGWVVRADHDGTPWVEAVSLSCPDAPTVDVLAGMNRLEALACFRDRTLSIRAFVSGGEPADDCPADAATACLDGPAWLAGAGGRTATLDARAPDPAKPVGSLRIARDPIGVVGEADLPTDRMATIEGAFNDPAASACSRGGPTTSVTTLTDVDAILRCRTTFVVSAAVADPAFLSRQTAAATTTNGLRVRSVPIVDDALSQRYEPLLAAGTRLFVLDGPVIGSGYDWYRVLVPTVVRSGGEPMLGWVAVASKTGEIWAKNLDLACPPAAAPVALAEIARLTSGAVTDGGLACFGDVPVSTTGTISIACPGPDAGSTDPVAWLAAPARMTVRLSDGGVFVDARVHPDLAGRTSCDAGDPATRWVATGHFDDPDAPSCALASPTEATAALATWRCRAMFVVADLTPVVP